MNPVEAIRSADGLYAMQDPVSFLVYVAPSTTLHGGQAVVAGQFVAPLNPNSTTDEVSPDE